MTSHMQSIEYFKKQAKQLFKQFEMKEPLAIARVEIHINDISNVSLMKIQHVIALEFGFEKWNDIISTSETARKLAIVMNRIPDLSDFGFGIYNMEKMNRANSAIKLAEERAILLGKHEVVEQTKLWILKNIEPIRTINYKRSSYSLKHMAERSMKVYITNGTFIAAAILAGFDFKVASEGANAFFAMSEKSIKQIITKTDPPGAIRFN